MRVWVEGSKTKTKNSTKAGTKKRTWPRRVMASSTKFQFPNSRLQRNPGIETPKTKLQTPKKSQVPSSKPLPALRAWNLELGPSLVFGAWELGLLWTSVFGVWCFSKSFPGQVFFLGRPIVCRLFQVQLAGQNFSAHLVKHGGLLRPVTGVRRRDQRLCCGQHLQHSRRQRVVGKLRRVPAHGKVPQFGELTLILPRQQQFEKLDRGLWVFCARVDQETGAHSRHRVYFPGRRGHGENANLELELILSPRVGDVGQEPRAQDVLRRLAAQEHDLRVDVAQRTDGTRVQHAGQIETAAFQQGHKRVQTAQLLRLAGDPGPQQVPCRPG